MNKKQIFIIMLGVLCICFTLQLSSHPIHQQIEADYELEVNKLQKESGADKVIKAINGFLRSQKRMIQLMGDYVNTRMNKTDLFYGHRAEIFAQEKKVWASVDAAEKKKESDILVAYNQWVGRMEASGSETVNTSKAAWIKSSDGKNFFYAKMREMFEGYGNLMDNFLDLNRQWRQGSGAKRLVYYEAGLTDELTGFQTDFNIAYGKFLTFTPEKPVDQTKTDGPPLPGRTKENLDFYGSKTKVSKERTRQSQKAFTYDVDRPSSELVAIMVDPDIVPVQRKKGPELTFTAYGTYSSNVAEPRKLTLVEWELRDWKGRLVDKQKGDTFTFQPSGPGTFTLKADFKKYNKRVITKVFRVE